MALDYQQLAQGVNFLTSLSNPNYSLNRHEILTVNGLQEAKDYKLNRNERVALIDANSDVLYIKECDEIGKYNLKIYECTDVTDKFEMQNTPASISKAEFDELKNSLVEMRKLLEVKNEHNVYQQKQQPK